MSGVLKLRRQRPVRLAQRACRFRPLRQLYISMSDDIIYTGIQNFFVAVNTILWTNVNPDAYIRKTVGIQALFDVAQRLIGEMVGRKDFRLTQFEERIRPARSISPIAFFRLLEQVAS